MKNKINSPKQKRKSPTKNKSPKRVKIPKGGSNDELSTPSPSLDNLSFVDSGTTYNGIKWIKTGSIGYAVLNIYLKEGQEVVADKHSLIMMDTDMELKTKMGSATKALGRLLTGEKAFLNHFEGTAPKGYQRLSLGLGVPGDIVFIPLLNGEQIKVCKGSFIAGLNNTSVSSALNWRGYFTNEGILLQHISTKDNQQNGGVWLSSYGVIEKHVVPENKSIYINPEHFLCCSTNVKHTLKRKHSIKSILAGSDIWGLEFKGPCTVYTQSNNKYKLIDLVEANIKEVGEGISNAARLTNSLIND